MPFVVFLPRLTRDKKKIHQRKLITLFGVSVDYGNSVYRNHASKTENERKGKQPLLIFFIFIFWFTTG